MRIKKGRRGRYDCCRRENGGCRVIRREEKGQKVKKNQNKRQEKESEEDEK